MVVEFFCIDHDVLYQNVVESLLKLLYFTKQKLFVCCDALSSGVITKFHQFNHIFAFDQQNLLLMAVISKKNTRIYFVNLVFNTASCPNSLMFPIVTLHFFSIITFYILFSPFEFCNLKFGVYTSLHLDNF